MPSYKLCSSNSECTGGDTCMMGQITTYCGPMMGGFMFDGNFPAFDGGGFVFDSSTTTQEDSGSSASEAGPAADTGAE
jgi:hypothetical protein